MVIVVLVAFGRPAARIGVLAMLPAWWKHRASQARRATPPALAGQPSPGATPTQPSGSDFGPEHPPRDGL